MYFKNCSQSCPIFLLSIKIDKGCFINSKYQMLILIRTLLFTVLWISCCASLSFILGCMNNSLYSKKSLKENKKNGIKNRARILSTFLVAAAILSFGLLYSFEILTIQTFIQFYILSIFLTLAISEKIYILSFVKQTLQPCSQPVLEELSRI